VRLHVDVPELKDGNQSPDAAPVEDAEPAGVDRSPSIARW
jgi:hypothetical protein